MASMTLAKCIFLNSDPKWGMFEVSSITLYTLYTLNDRSTVNSIFYIIESSHTSFVVLNIDRRSGYPNFKLARRSSNDTEEGVTEASSGSQFVKPWGSDLLMMFEMLVVDDNFLWKDNWSLYQFFLIMYVCLRKCAGAVLAVNVCRDMEERMFDRLSDTWFNFNANMCFKFLPSGYKAS